MGKRSERYFDRVTFEGRRDGAGEYHGFVVEYQKAIRIFWLESGSQIDIRRRSKISAPGKEASKFEVNRLTRGDL